MFRKVVPLIGGVYRLRWTRCSGETRTEELCLEDGGDYGYELE